jgi:tetratricopeptide (TPR) repeat protein
MLRKTQLLLNRTEMLDTESQESYADWSRPLRIGGVVGHFGVLVPLAAVGLMITWAERRRLAVLFALAGAYAASVILFFVYARYRYPLVPFLIMFAAVALVELSAHLARWLRHRSTTGVSPLWTRRGAVYLAIAAALAALTIRPMVAASRMRAITEHNYGAALQSDGRMAAALAHYERATTFDADYAPAHSNMGTALSALGRNEDARRAYERALELDPNFADAHFNLGNALMREGNPSAAAPHFEHAASAMPGAADVQHNLGLAFSEAGRPDEARAAYERALALAPGSVETLTALAEVEAAGGRVDNALEHLRRAAQLRPNAAAHHDVARLLVESERPEEAIPEFEAALRLAPADAAVRNDYGAALANAGRTAEAMRQFEEALRLSPGLEAAANNLAAARASTARPERLSPRPQRPSTRTTR